MRNLPPYRGNAPGKEIKVWSVMLIEGEGNCIDWPLGLVDTIHPGKDGLVRAVKLKTAKGLIDRFKDYMTWKCSPLPLF